MDRYFDVEIGVCRLVMRIFGIWPRDRNFTVSVRFVVLLVVMIGFCNIPQTVQLFRVSGNFDELLEVITNCNLTIMVAVVKNLLFWSNNEAVCQLLDAMDVDWKARKTEIERKIMHKNAKLSRLATVIVLWSFESAVFSFLVMNGYNRSKEAQLFSQGKINESERWRPLYLPSHFAYDVQKSPHYEITWILQFLTTLFAASTFGVIDGFFSSLVLHLCAQMKNLRGRFAKVLVEATTRGDGSARLHFSSIVERHEFLMWFADTIEHVFNVQFLVQLLSSLLIFCLTGYQIVKIITSDAIFLLELIFAIYYYLCFASSLFVYCLIATFLSTESTKMRETAYDSEWYELSPSDARLLILIMIRTRKPFELTAGKFVAFSLELYCSVVKTSGGYLSMLIAMKNRMAVN